MVKFLGVNIDNDNTMVCVGLSKEDVEALKGGDPIRVDLEEMGISGLDLMVISGDTNHSIAEDMFKKHGKVPPPKDPPPHAH